MSNDINTTSNIFEENADNLEKFSQELEKIGIFPRDYDQPNLEKLYSAAETVHKHLCALDKNYYSNARQAKVYELANAYALGQRGIRTLE